MATIYTLAHSTRDLADFSAVLQDHEIAMLVDIRAFPMSRRHPQFDREQLEMWLPEIGLGYRWMRELGGRRRKIKEHSPHVALRNESFRNYADYMLTPEFERAAAEVVALAEKQRAAIMCAELLWFRCHRMLVSDHLTARGHTVLHIENAKPPKLHELTKEARLVEGTLLYKGDRLL